MRICSPQLGISPSATRGGEVYDRETLRELARLGVEVEILLPSGLPHPRVPNWRVTHTPLKRGYRWFISNLIFVPYIGRLHRKRPFHLLRVHSPRFTGLAALWARRLYRMPLPIVAHHHHIDPDPWLRRIDKPVLQKAELVITGSHFAKQQLTTQLQISPKKVQVIYNGVNSLYKPDPDRRTQIRQKLNLASREVLLHVGSLIPRKNLFQLLRVFQEIITSRPKAYLILVGQGPQANELQEYAAELNVAHATILTGPVSEQEKLDYLHAADLYVSTSRMEGFGLSLAEAMACGVPVVAFDVGSLSEVVCHEETGLLVPEQDTATLVMSIQKLLTEPDLAQRMGQAGAERVDRQFRWARAATKIHNAYQALLT